MHAAPPAACPSGARRLPAPPGSGNSRRPSPHGQRRPHQQRHGRGGGAEARAPHVRPRHLFSGAPRSRGGGACVSGPETVVGAPAPLLVVQSGDPSLSWPLKFWPCLPWSPKVISTECQTDLVFLGGSVGKESACNAGRRRGFDPWIGKIPWRRDRLIHSSILPWRIPWTEEPGGLQFMGSQRVGHPSE